MKRLFLIPFFLSFSVLLSFNVDANDTCLTCGFEECTCPQPQGTLPIIPTALPQAATPINPADLLLQLEEGLGMIEQINASLDDQYPESEEALEAFHTSARHILRLLALIQLYLQPDSQGDVPNDEIQDLIAQLQQADISGQSLNVALDSVAALMARISRMNLSDENGRDTADH